MIHRGLIQDIVEAYVGEPDVRIMPALFSGELVADDSKPEKPWAYLKVDKGIPRSAYDALQAVGVPCQPWFDNPHVTVIKNDEAKELVDTYGDGWKEAVEGGPDSYVFTMSEMVDVDPIGWDEMDRVWFIRVDCPELQAKRTMLGLTPLPTSEDGQELQFHITVGVRPKNGMDESDMRRTILRTLLS